MTQIEVSEKTLNEFNRLLTELNKLYPNQKLSNDQIMEAMIGWFFDSLAYMQNQTEAHNHWHDNHHWHQHNHDDECCGGSDECENKKDWACCGWHH